MNEPRRLRDLHQEDAFGAAFRSADQDGPSFGKETKLLASLGLTAVAVAATPSAVAATGGAAAGASSVGTAASTTTATVTTAAAGGAGIAAKVGGGSVLAKWMIGSVIVVSGSVFGTVVADRAIPSPQAASPVGTIASIASIAPIAPIAPIAQPVASADPRAEPEVLPAPVVPEPEVLPAPAAPEPAAISNVPVHSAPAPAPAAPRIQPTNAPPARSFPAGAATEEASHSGEPTAVSSRSTVDTLPSRLLDAYGGAQPSSSSLPPVVMSARSVAPELKELESVRALLTAGRVSEALITLDAYQKAFPDGVLLQESEVLRLDALVRSGKRAMAEARAHAFLAQHPQSVQAARVRALLARGGAQTDAR